MYICIYIYISIRTHVCLIAVLVYDSCGLDVVQRTLGRPFVSFGRTLVLNMWQGSFFKPLINH